MIDNEQPQEQSSIVVEFHSPGGLEFDIKTQGCGPVHLLAAAGCLQRMAEQPGQWEHSKSKDSYKVAVVFAQDVTLFLGDRVSFIHLLAAAGYLRTMGERQLNDMWTAEAVRKQRDHQAQRQVENLIRQKPGFILPTDGAH